jgi:hypothetical protein
MTASILLSSIIWICLKAASPEAFSPAFNLPQAAFSQRS